MYLRRKSYGPYETKYDIGDNIRNYLPYLQTVLIIAGSGAQCRMQVSNMFTFNFIFLPQKQIRGDLKAYHTMEMSLNNAVNTWQITEMSDSMRRL